MAVLLLWIMYVITVLPLLCFRAHLFIDALWSPAEKGLTFWLSFVISYCEVGILGYVWCLIVSIRIFALFLLWNEREIHVSCIVHTCTW